MTGRNISFAQNGEDIVLWRALHDISDGVYLDVGANHPTDMSVTRKFYDAGWSGIAVEPNHEYAELFRTERPRDVVFEAVASDIDAPSVTFHLIEGTGLSTVDDTISQGHASSGWEVKDVEVPVVSLTQAIVSSGFAERDLHFLSVDTEGSEASVLKSLDFTRFRPWILVIEATAPLSTTQVHENWQHLVESAGYTFCLFDGLSRFYVANEHLERLGDLVSYSAGVLDDYVEAEFVRVETVLNNTDAALRAAKLQIDELDEELASEKQHTDELQAELDAEHLEAVRLGRLVADLQHTVSWRVTKPLRRLRGEH